MTQEKMNNIRFAAATGAGIGAGQAAMRDFGQADGTFLNLMVGVAAAVAAALLTSLIVGWMMKKRAADLTAAEQRRSCK